MSYIYITLHVFRLCIFPRFLVLHMSSCHALSGSMTLRSRWPCVRRKLGTTNGFGLKPEGVPVLLGGWDPRTWFSGSWTMVIVVVVP